MTTIPENLRYSKEHEWVKLEGNIAIVGITEYATEQLGDVVHVELPELNTEFEKDHACSTVESVKSVSDVFMPVSGKILAINEVLSENPAIINEDPYGEGWVFKVELTHAEETERLLSASDYKKFLSEEN